MKVIGNNSFGEAIAKLLGAEFIKFDQRIFPDGEVCPRVIDKIDDAIVIVNHMSLPIEPNKYFIETLLLLKDAIHLGARNVDVVMPYFVYSRQDKVFRDGEPLSAKFMLETFEKAGARNFFIVSSHAEREKDKLTIANIPTYNVNGFVDIGNYLKIKDFLDPVVIGPDEGAEFFAKTVADVLGCRYCLLDKERNLDTGEIEMKCNADVNGKDVVIVDDIISSGGTMLRAIDLLKKAGAKDVYCYVVHMVSEQAMNKISPHVKEFLCSDTIETPLSRISVIENVAKRIGSV